MMVCEHISIQGAYSVPCTVLSTGAHSIREILFLGNACLSEAKSNFRCLLGQRKASQSVIRNMLKKTGGSHPAMICSFAYTDLYPDFREESIIILGGGGRRQFSLIFFSFEVREGV